MKTIRIAIIAMCFSSGANAQQITYQPINPSFGGSSFNSSHLLATAEIDRPDPPSNELGGLFGGDADEVTQASLFAEQLERTILGRLSANITNAIFGENAEPSGSFTYDQTEVSFDTALNGDITLTITDTITQGTTTIEIPGFLNQAN